MERKLPTFVLKAIDSETFKRSPKSQKLLDFIAQKSVALGPNQVTGSLLETEFFGLGDSLPNAKSSICRVQISRIKSLLATFYETEGQDEPWQLAFEAGSYGLTLKPSTADQSSFAPRLCILPLLNLGGDTRQQQICTGLMLDLVHLFAQSRTLRVLTLPQLGAASTNANSELTAKLLTQSDFALEGSVRFQPAAYKIAIRLNDCKTHQVVWSEEFNLAYDTDRLFDLQSEIAVKIAAQLATPTGVIDRLARSKAQNGSAYSAVLRFYAYTEQFTPELHQQAKVELLDAVKDSPLYAEAWACLSGVYWNEYFFEFNPSADTEDPLRKSVECAQHALKLAPDSVTGTYALAVALFQQGDLALFREYAQKTLDMAPYRADLIAGIGFFQAYAGDWSLGLSLMDRARELAPLHPDWYWIPYVSDAYLREDHATALQYAKRVNPQSFPFFQLYTAAVYHRLQMPQEALESLNAIKVMVPDLMDKLDAMLWRFLHNEKMHQKMLDDLLAVNSSATAS
jgi:adenylate cyclase